MVDGMALSSSLKPLPNKHLQSLASDPRLHGFDGELTVGDPSAKDVYRSTNSAVMSADGEPEIMLRVFDLFDHGGPYAERLAALAEKVDSLPDSLKRFVQVVPSAVIECAESLNVFERDWVADKGFEGVMIRCPNGLYKHGRSTLKQGWLLKVKRFADDEAIIIGANEQMTNTNDAVIDARGLTSRSNAKSGLTPSGVLGNLIVDWRGVTFEIGTGFTASDRSDLWQKIDELIGAVVKFKYFPVGMKDKPRHPVFLGFRDPIDITDY